MKYKVCTDIDSFDEKKIAESLAWFPQERVDNILKMKTLQGRREKVIAYLLLIDLLKEEGLFYELPQLSYNELGKPSLANYPSVHFNMSHCKRAVAVAIHNAPVGIDVECDRRISPELIRRVCNENEISAVNGAADSAMEFVRLWTRKEALLKCMGCGIRDDLRYVLSDNADYQIETMLIPEAETFLSICTK
ncbi:MAG: 4'-phosphopantetheinyl transferase superfamily protein [Bacteroidales bacterium]|nr:4'-phosphopantetheinyl transferase superfamily protein [Bacteroidales bacterium]